MSYYSQIQIKDDLGQLVRTTESNELRAVQAVRLAGQLFHSGVVDTNFWTVTNANAGTTTQSNGSQVLATNTTANGSTQVVSVDIARFVGHNENEYTGIIQFGDTGTVNNTRRWGPFNGTDGAYFKLSGTTLSVATVKGGVETAVPSGSWNGTAGVPTLTNIAAYRIEYRINQVRFFINGAVAHTASFTTSWANTSNFTIWHDNVNSGGSTTNVTMNVFGAVVYRLGPTETQPKYFHGTTGATTVLKYTPGMLHRICINTTPASGTATLTLYDNTAGSGTTIAVFTGQANMPPVSVDYHLQFNTGLTIVSSGTWDFTVVYQ